MKKTAKFAAAIAVAVPFFLFCAVTSSASDAKDAKVEEELIKLEDRLNDAAIKVDTDFINSVTADDYTAIFDDGATADRNQTIDLIKSGALKISAASNDDYRVKVYGKTAVVTYRTALKGDYKGKDISGQYRETDVWVKHGRHWQCVAAHLSKVTGQS